jgi:hypothetical protein
MLAAMYLGYARVTAPLPERKELLGATRQRLQPESFDNTPYIPAINGGELRRHSVKEYIILFLENTTLFFVLSRNTFIRAPMLMFLCFWLSLLSAQQV